MKFLEVVVALAIKEFEQRRSKLTSRKKTKGYFSDTYVFIHESVTRCVTRCLVSRETVDLIRYTE